MAGYSGRGVHGSTVEFLGSRIVGGSLQPGEVLDLTEIGTELDVSKTALREALKVLTSKGLVDARQRKGTFVTERATWNILDSDVIRWHEMGGRASAVLADLAEVRAIIEPGAASLAALRRTDDDIAELDAALADMRASVHGSAQEAVDADLRWHRALLHATHNQMLAQLEAVIAPAHQFRDAVVHGHSDDDPVPSHELVTEAVRAGDPDRAAEASSALIAKATEDLAAALGPHDDNDRGGRAHA